MIWNSATPMMESRFLKQCEFVVEKSFLKIKYLNFSQSNLCADEPVVIKKLRADAKNIEEFDTSLDSLINLYTKQPELDYPDGKNK